MGNKTHTLTRVHWQATVLGWLKFCIYLHDQDFFLSECLCLLTKEPYVWSTMSRNRTKTSINIRILHLILKFKDILWNLISTDQGEKWVDIYICIMNDKGVKSYLELSFFFTCKKSCAFIFILSTIICMQTENLVLQCR